MRFFNEKQERILKRIHVTLAIIWAIGCFLMMINVGFMLSYNPIEFYNSSIFFKNVEYYIIIPGWFCCFITSLMYSLFTPWGFFKHKWIIVKWLILIIMLIIGRIFIFSFVRNNSYSSHELYKFNLTNIEFYNNSKLITICGGIQAMLLIIGFGISMMCAKKRDKKEINK